MTLSNRLIWVSWELRAANNMTPQHTDSIAPLDRDDFGGDRLLEVRVTGNVCVINILDRVVGQGSADANCFAVVNAVDAGYH